MQQHDDKLPEIIVFAGPNGSGKSTITKMAKVIEPYTNADDIKRTNYCSDLEAAQFAERMRENAIANKNGFTFETVLSTERNLNLCLTCTLRILLSCVQGGGLYDCQ